MRGTSDERPLSFVNYDGPKLPQDPTLRRLIRQRAMRDIAAARRQRGDYGQHNLGQSPRYLNQGPWNEDLPFPRGTLPNDAVPRRSQNGAPSDGEWTTDRKRWSRHSAVSCRRASVPHMSIMSQGLGVPEDFCLLLNFMPLEGLRRGIATFSRLTFEPARTGGLYSVPHLGSRKVLSFIPSRYGHISLLSHATDCVVAKLRQMMQPPDSRSANGEATVLLHYSKALRALQAALDDETQRMAPETLCATELLGVFEVLNGNSGAHSWTRHVGGASRLIEIRGAHRFNTEFELALFMAHFGPIVMEAFLSNTSCFLAEERWQQVMRLAICNNESFADQKDLVLSLWGYLVRGPTLFKDTTEMIFSSNPPPQSAINGLIERLLNSRDSMLRWLSQLQQRTGSRDGEPESFENGLTLPWSTFESSNLGSEYVTQLALRGTYIMCRILKGRLLFALAPSRFHHLEVECQDLAGRIIDQRQNSTKDQGGRHIWNFFMSQSTWIAYGILETKEAWSQGWEGREGMIEKWKFEDWCRAIGRKFPSEGGSV